ncbi:MAG TPA: DUF305 domain-containing protein [Hyphomicrobiaceae bacterium]|nr:DUF305 domain-containing protein [Hyphomicrobiaceae bacterium]
MRKILLPAALATAAFATFAIAQQGMQHGGPMQKDKMPMQGQQMPGMMPGMMHGMGGMGSMKPKGDNSPASLAFHGVNAKMHEAMDITFTGDADRDFVTGMIPHHQGAIDMAKVVLAFGKDPEVKKLAQDIIKAQEQEIAWMKAWLAKSAK